MAITSTPNLGLNLIARGESGWDQYLNSNFEKLDIVANNIYQQAVGSGTAITLNMPPISSLANGYALTFIASANNNGSATTINNLPLYKPGTTTAPILIQGKAYSIWYNSTSNCFFYKASAEGNTVSAHVLANDTFSNNADIGLVGTMPDNGTLNYTPSNISQSIPSGHTDGGTIDAVTFDTSKVLNDTTIANTQGTMPNLGTPTYIPTTSDQTINGYVNNGIIKGDANLIARYIKKDISIFDVTGDKLLYGAGDNITVPNVTLYPKTIIGSLGTPQNNRPLIDNVGNIYYVSDTNIIKYDSSGVQLWSYTWSTTNGTITYDADIDPINSIVYIGTNYGLMKIPSSGGSSLFISVNTGIADAVRWVVETNNLYVGAFINNTTCRVFKYDMNLVSLATCDTSLVGSGNFMDLDVDSIGNIYYMYYNGTNILVSTMLWNGTSYTTTGSQTIQLSTSSVVSRKTMFIDRTSNTLYLIIPNGGWLYKYTLNISSTLMTQAWSVSLLSGYYCMRDTRDNLPIICNKYNAYGVYALQKYSSSGALIYDYRTASLTTACLGVDNANNLYTSDTGGLFRIYLGVTINS